MGVGAVQGSVCEERRAALAGRAPRALVVEVFFDALSRAPTVDRRPQRQGAAPALLVVL